jgi:hypothetical protein
MIPVQRLAFPTFLLLFACTAASAFAGDNAKPARGIVTSIGGDSIMINLPSDTDVVFRIDSNTCVVARGAGRKMREAQAHGASGVKLSDVLPIGGAVSVRYEERDGQRYARRIVRVASAGNR